MKVNVGTVDRALRMIAGVVLMVLAAFGVIGWWGWLGFWPALIATIGYCPLYSLIGLNTCGKKGC